MHEENYSSIYYSIYHSRPPLPLWECHFTLKGWWPDAEFFYFSNTFNAYITKTYRSLLKLEKKNFFSFLVKQLKIVPLENDFFLDFVYLWNDVDSVNVKVWFHIQRKHDFQYKFTVERIFLACLLFLLFFLIQNKGSRDL